jgi:dTDP-4-dehydrorhamnose 3,5-epimerase-like enzyme
MSSVIHGVAISSQDAAAISITESFRRLEFSQHSLLQVHGMHFSASEVQILCVIGRVMVAICDLRVSSTSCMTVQLIELHAFRGDEMSSLPSSVVIPAGCARGIVSICDSTASSVITFNASPSQLDNSELPSAIAWNDPTLAVAWPPLSKAAPSCESYPPLPSSFKAATSPRPSLPLAISNSPIRSSCDPYAPSVILLSGGAGFIGSHVIRHLSKKYPDYTIINFDVLDHCSSLNNLSDVAELRNYRFVHGDICNLDLVDYVFKINQARARCSPSPSLPHAATCSHGCVLQVDTVMHFAAQSHVDNSFGNSLEFTKANVLGTHVMLEAARRYRVRRFIHVSTDEVLRAAALPYVRCALTHDGRCMGMFWAKMPRNRR